MGLLPLQYLHWVTWAKALATRQASGVYSHHHFIFSQIGGSKVKSMTLVYTCCILLPPPSATCSVSRHSHPINLGTVLSFLPRNEWEGVPSFRHHSSGSEVISTVCHRAEGKYVFLILFVPTNLRLFCSPHNHPGHQPGIEILLWYLVPSKFPQWP